MTVRIAALAAAAVTDAEYARAWQRLLAHDRVWGLGAHLDGKLVGITHYLFHTGAWNDQVCYLQDLFVDPALRGGGARPRRRKALLAHPGSQRHGARALRQGGEVQQLHPL